MTSFNVLCAIGSALFIVGAMMAHENKDKQLMLIFGCIGLVIFVLGAPTNV